MCGARCRPSTAGLAANILLDIRKAFVRAIEDSQRLVPVESLFQGGWGASPSAEHEALEALSATVVWRTRVQEDDDTTSPRRRRTRGRGADPAAPCQRAERQLAAAT